MIVRRSDTDIELNPITLSFSGANANLEAGFLHHYFTKSLRQMRLSVLLGAGLYALFGILDAIIVPEFTYEFWLIRAAAIISMLTTVALSYGYKKFHAIMQHCLTVLILISGMGIILMIVIAPQPVNDVYYAGLILVIFMGYTFIKARFLWALVGCWVLVFLYQIAALGFTRTPVAVLINNNFFFISANIIGMFAAYSIERMERRDFFLATLLREEKENVQKINAGLEERVQQRTDEIAQANRELLREIEERKKTERELRLIRTAIEQASESVVITNASGLIQYVNPAFERISGYSRKEANGMALDRLNSGQRSPVRFSEIQQQLASGETWAGRLANRDKFGCPFEVEATIAPIRDETGRITHNVSVQRDMTQESELRRQLRQAQKMEAIGSLAGGIAHDFNNILVPIIGHAEIALLEAPEGSHIRNSLREILKAAARAKDLVGQILAFSRQSEIEFRPLKINIVVREAVRLLRASIPPSIDIVNRVSKNCGPVMGDPSQIHQVILNLATNAYHAMAETGGTMTVSLSEVVLDDSPSGSGPQMPKGRYVRLSVEDTGCGFDKTMIDKIFDPYFTTKPQGEGTGLGLSVVHGIVTSHAGRIFADSTPGQGSRFTVYLPRVDSLSPSSTIGNRPRPVGGSEHILVVDDEEAITGMFKKMLKRLGYDVTTCESGEEARDLLRSNPKGFDLVITDYAMPRMSGIELAEALREIRPDMPILLCTGVSETLSLSDMEPFGIADILLKPVFSNELDAKIRTVLPTQPSTKNDPD